MNKLLCFFIKKKLRRLGRKAKGTFNPEVSQQIDCLQFLLDTLNSERDEK
jgi:hypothetical protein